MLGKTERAEVLCIPSRQLALSVGLTGSPGRGRLCCRCLDSSISCLIPVDCGTLARKDASDSRGWRGQSPPTEGDKEIMRTNMAADKGDRLLLGKE